MFIFPIYNHSWRNNITIYIYITRLASNGIFSPSNKIHREVGRAKELSALRVRHSRRLPIPEAAGSNVWICGCSLAEIPGAWMSVACVRCVLSGRGLCDELMTSQEESYRAWFFCDRGTSYRWPKPIRSVQP